MKNTRASFLLALAGLSGVASGQIGLPEFVPTDRPETYAAALMGTALGPAAPRLLAWPNGNHGSMVFAVQPVRVVDSRTFAPGTLVDVYLPYRARGADDFAQRPEGPIEQTGALPIGRSVLLLGAASPKVGVLRAPYGPSVATMDFAIPVGPAVPPKVAAYAFFETAQARLAAASDPMWRMLCSVAAAIRGTSDANVRKIGDFLESVRIPRTDAPHGFSRADDQLSSLFADAVAQDTAYHRALIHHALNTLFYVGYGDRYRKDVYASAADPHAFPDGVPELSYWERPEALEPGLPKDFRHDADPDPSDVVALLKRANSPTVAAWLLKNLDKPADADVRGLARFLDFGDPRARWALVERLAAWYGLPAPEKPREARQADGGYAWEYPGLDAAVAFWKARLKGL